MRAVQATVFVPEDTAVRVDTQVSASGTVRGWLSLGEGRELSLWGSPAALSRLAVALLGAANAAERAGAEQASAVERESV
jgi:hypothetical protein